jgi:hypothetical protein
LLTSKKSCFGLTYKIIQEIEENVAAEDLGVFIIK